MSNNKVVLDVESLYSFELADIRNRLTQMENGRISEITHAGYDGSLATNVVKLREDFEKLISDIKYGRTTSHDQLDDLF
ncbi:hypothetical protein [Oceanobacillus sp. 1P07AA]|uniref:hypothetical protein n=1 Tax=Oceanobacillus sp. 1P07AA TaxID=3132293 RepID=UPI0039A525E9